MKKIFNLNGDIIFQAEDLPDPIDEILSEIINSEPTCSAIQPAGKLSIEEAVRLRKSLSEAYLVGCYLGSANLSFGDFRGSNMTGSFMCSADLKHADISSAKLIDVDLSEANLRECVARKSNFVSSRFFRADLTKSNMRESDLTGAHLVSAKLAYADLRGVNFSGADLDDADLSYSDLSGAIFRGAYLDRAVLTGANLTGADLRGSSMLGTEINHANIDQIKYDCNELEHAKFDETVRVKIENDLALYLKIEKELSGSGFFNIDKIEWLNRRYGRGASDRVIDSIKIMR
jgi:uncharacterized protein YjbI with pentapeptide repeats